MKNKKYLYLITIIYFSLGFINIHLALLGLFCMLLPFALLARNKKKVWCQSYCPRAAFYTKLGILNKAPRKTPKFFTHGNMRRIILAYFFVSLFLIFMSTRGVMIGRINPMDYLRLFLFIRIPGTLPQFIELEQVTPWLTHLSYRMYSMMMTTTILGSILALTYRPRTWCTICPIGTLSDAYLDKVRKK